MVVEIENNGGESMTGEVWITIPEAARLLAIGVPATRALVASRQLTARMVPGSWLKVRRDEVERLAEASTVPARDLQTAEA